MIDRCRMEGRFPRAPASTAAALELWVQGHGTVSLILSGAVPARPAMDIMRDALVRLYASYGDALDAASASIDRGRRRFIGRLATAYTAFPGQGRVEL